VPVAPLDRYAPAVDREPGERGDPAPVRSRLHAVAVLLVALLVAGTIVATVAGTLSLTRRSDATGPPPAATAAPTELAAPPAATSLAAPNDPHSAFRDPALRALAESFLAGPAVSCAQRPPATDEAENVACDLGEGRAAVFTRMVTPDVMRDQRRGVVEGQAAEPGTVVSVRWRYVAGRPGTRAGVPDGQNDRGEGVRVRFVDREGVPRLYFDQDSSGCTGELALTRPTGNDLADLDALRSFWANPAR
jgi:hypothetical protein